MIHSPVRQTGKTAPMATWEIVGGDLPPVRVRARTFDEALAKARLRDPGYCAGWVVEEG